MSVNGEPISVSILPGTWVRLVVCLVTRGSDRERWLLSHFEPDLRREDALSREFWHTMHVNANLHYYSFLFFCKNWRAICMCRLWQATAREADRIVILVTESTFYQGNQNHYTMFSFQCIPHTDLLSFFLNTWASIPPFPSTATARTLISLSSSPQWD